MLAGPSVRRYERTVLAGFLSRRAASRRPEGRPGLLGLVALASLMMAFLLPLALGPALAPLTRALGVAPEHACACGMKPGTCGCPECERLLREGDAPVPTTHATLGSCDDHGSRSLASALPPCFVPPAFAVAASPHVGLLAPVPPPPRLSTQPSPPPTPPPRYTLV